VYNDGVNIAKPICDILVFTRKSGQVVIDCLNVLIAVCLCVAVVSLEPGKPLLPSI